MIVDLSQAFTDVDIATNGDEFSFEVSSGETLATYSLEGSPGAFSLKLLLLENQNGQDVLNITATDIEGLSVTVPLTLVVTPMNDVPLAVDDVALAKQNEITIINTLDLLVNDEDVDKDLLALNPSINPSYQTIRTGIINWMW